MSATYDDIDGEIILIATITATPGREAEVVEWLRKISAEVKAKEPGTLEYSQCRDGQTGNFIAWERYVNKDAVELHFKNEGLAGLFASGAIINDKLKLEYYNGKF